MQVSQPYCWKIVERVKIALKVKASSDGECSVLFVRQSMIVYIDEGSVIGWLKAAARYLPKAASGWLLGLPDKPRCCRGDQRHAAAGLRARAEYRHYRLVHR